MPLKARTRIFLQEDVEKHSRPGDCWVTYRGKVYDVSHFVEDHPGGDDLILQFAGRDVEEAMDDPTEHSHSDSAYDVLAEFQIGIIGAEEAIVREDFVMTDTFEPDETVVADDYKRNQFLDLDRPLLWQVWTADFSKAFYLQQVHQPRHLPRSARLFGPSYLEVFTLTPWYVVPLVWLPIAGAIFYRSLQQHSVFLPSAQAWSITWAGWGLGVFVWTLLEYIFHRFLFHIDTVLPDRPFFLMLHFLLHGIHHYLPMDKMRLVMPPILFATLSFPMTRLAHLIFPTAFANAIISGAFCMYVVYDVGHWSMHHVKIPNIIKHVKKYHMEHHVSCTRLFTASMLTFLVVQAA